MAKLHFLGAAQEVTGSCYLIETGGRKILLECGMHQGGDNTERLKQESFAFDPREIDAVILSHGHLDHCGLLPKLVHQGFHGPILCTRGTQKLIKVMLEDATGLYLKDLEYENLRRSRAGRQQLPAEFTMDDVHQVLSLTEGYDYGEQASLFSMDITFLNAGHILGSAIVKIGFRNSHHYKTLVFSGDLGNPDASLMPNYTYVTDADVVLMESTYGNRNHRKLDDTLKEFEDIIAQAEADNGNILIPSFAVGRTQEMLFHLGRLYHAGKLKNWHVFLDSPMAEAVTDIYSHCMKQLDHDDVKLIRDHQGKDLTSFLPNLTISKTVEDSMAINRIHQGAIIIAGSGMCTGGRIRHHLKHRLWYHNTHLLFVGYQARGTLGRILVDGVKKVKLFGEPIAVKARIHTLGGFSAHAGQSDLLDWASHFKNYPRFFLVHGEPDSMDVLSDKLSELYGINAEIPARNSTIHI